MHASKMKRCLLVQFFSSSLARSLDSFLVPPSFATNSLKSLLLLMSFLSLTHTQHTTARRLSTVPPRSCRYDSSLAFFAGTWIWERLGGLLLLTGT